MPCLDETNVLNIFSIYKNDPVIWNMEYLKKAIAIIQKHLVKEIIPSITDNEFSVFESQEIRDVCCYLLGKGFSKISVLNSIRELSPFDYYSAIQKNKISLASSTFNTNEDEEIIINKELAILQSELNQINEIYCNHEDYENNKDLKKMVHIKYFH